MTITDEQLAALRKRAEWSREVWYENTLPHSYAMLAIADAKTVLALLDRLAAAEAENARLSELNKMQHLALGVTQHNLERLEGAIREVLDDDPSEDTERNEKGTP